MKTFRIQGKALKMLTQLTTKRRNKKTVFSHTLPFFMKLLMTRMLSIKKRHSQRFKKDSSRELRACLRSSMKGHTFTMV